MGQGRDGGRDGRRGAWRLGGSALGPRGVLGVQAGTGTWLQLCLPFPALPSLPAGAGVGLELSPGHWWGVPNSTSQAWCVPTVSPWALRGCWLTKPPLAWKNPTIPEMGAGEVAPGWEQRFHWC